MREAKPTPPPTLNRLWAPAVGAAMVVALSPGAAWAQSDGSQFNSGYSGSNFNRSIDVATRDEDNNQIFINGRMQAPSGSVFSHASGVSRSQSGGVGDGSGLATAIGNNLSVVVQGSWNRVTVDSTQINNGDVSAQTTLNGSLDLR